MPVTQTKVDLQFGRAMYDAQHRLDKYIVVEGGIRFTPYFIDEDGQCTGPEAARNRGYAIEEGLGNVTPDHAEGCYHTRVAEHKLGIRDLFKEFAAMSPERRETVLIGYNDQARKVIRQKVSPGVGTGKVETGVSTVRVEAIEVSPDPGLCFYHPDNGREITKWTYSLDGMSYAEGVAFVQTNFPKGYRNCKPVAATKEWNDTLAPVTSVPSSA